MGGGGGAWRGGGRLSKQLSAMGNERRGGGWPKHSGGNKAENHEKRQKKKLRENSGNPHTIFFLGEGRSAQTLQSRGKNLLCKDCCGGPRQEVKGGETGKSHHLSENLLSEEGGRNPRAPKTEERSSQRYGNRKVRTRKKTGTHDCITTEKKQLPTNNRETKQKKARDYRGRFKKRKKPNRQAEALWGEGE